MAKRFYKNTKINAVKIFRALKQAYMEDRGPITVSEIARLTGLHKWSVSRTIDIWLHPFVESVIVEELEQVGLRIKLVKLKNPDLTEEQLLRGLNVKL
ncbi:MAG: hypothetical protein NTY20_00475 [Candidatus Aenigmarchaeota archaeon]|nr:hypothetical protein [Candidatus Aenigmarchaeota archaeon]